MSKCYWITGLSASGKTTISTMLVDSLRLSGNKVILLDGDELRQVLADKAYTREERIALGMRYSRLCQLIVSQNIDVVIAVIGLFKEIHKWNRVNIPGYTEIFLEVPLSELKKRDPKGLYTKYKNGKIKNVAGIDLKVDYPENPDICIKWTDGQSIESVFKELKEKIGVK